MSRQLVGTLLPHLKLLPSSNSEQIFSHNGGVFSQLMIRMLMLLLGLYFSLIILPKRHGTIDLPERTLKQPRPSAKLGKSGLKHRLLLEPHTSAMLLNNMPGLFRMVSTKSLMQAPYMQGLLTSPQYTGPRLPQSLLL